MQRLTPIHILNDALENGSKSEYSDFLIHLARFLHETNNTSRLSDFETRPRLSFTKECFTPVLHHLLNVPAFTFVPKELLLLITQYVVPATEFVFDSWSSNSRFASLHMEIPHFVNYLLRLYNNMADCSSQMVLDFEEKNSLLSLTLQYSNQHYIRNLSVILVCKGLVALKKK